MKNINVALEDSEHEELKKLKGDMSWKELLLSITKFKRPYKVDFSIDDVKIAVENAVRSAIEGLR